MWQDLCQMIPQARRREEVGNAHSELFPCITTVIILSPLSKAFTNVNSLTSEVRIIIHRIGQMGEAETQSAQPEAVGRGSLMPPGPPLPSKNLSLLSQ